VAPPGIRAPATPKYLSFLLKCRPFPPRYSPAGTLAGSGSDYFWRKKLYSNFNNICSRCCCILNGASESVDLCGFRL
jgi:hypothetical protein